eukprot:255083-Alexandrium_andersonii.AAC.1
MARALRQIDLFAAPKKQSAIRRRPVRAVVHLNPQSAMRKPQHRLTRSNVELRGPKSGLKLGPRSSRGVRSAPFPAQIPKPPTKWVLEGAQ